MTRYRQTKDGKIKFTPEQEAARELNAAMRSADPNAPGGSLTDIYNKYSLGHGTTLGSAFHTGANPREYMSYDTSRHADIIKVMAQRKAQEERDRANTQRVQQIEAEKAEAQERAKGQQIESAIKSAYGLDTMEGKKYALEAEMLGMPVAAYMDYVLTGNPEGISELGGTGQEFINPYNVYYSQELKRQQAGGIPTAQQIQYGQVMAPPWSHTQQSTAMPGGLPAGVPGLMGPGGSAPSPTPSSMYIPYADALSSYKQHYQAMNRPFTIGGYGAPDQSTWAEFERQWGNKGGLARVGYKNGLKVTDEDFYLGDPGFFKELPDPYKDLPEEERKMRKEMDEIMRKRFYKDPYEGMSEEEIEFIKNQLKIREQQRKDMGLPEGIQLLNQGGLARVGFKKGGMARRGFLKMIGGLSALPFVGKYFKAAKTAAPAAEAAVETIKRTAGGIPDYAFDLIEVVKAKGTKEIMEGVSRRFPAQKKYTYKGVEVTEDGLGTTSVRKQHEGIGYDEAGEGFEGVNKEVGFEIREGGYEQIGNPQFDDAAKSVKMDDEYFEATVRPDDEGKMKDVIEGIDDADHLDLKRIADESLIKKAEGGRVSLSKGGLAHVLGV